MLALPPVGPGQRHEVLHRRLRGNRAFAHRLLNRRRQDRHQGEPAADPALRTQKGPGKSLPAHPVDTRQFLKQPPLLKGAPSAGTLQAVREQKSFRLRKGQNHHRHGVPAQFAQRKDAPIPVDQDVPPLPAVHHQGGNALARLRQGDQKAALPGRVKHPKIPVPKIQLVELKLHRVQSIPCNLRIVAPAAGRPRPYPRRGKRSTTLPDRPQNRQNPGDDVGTIAGRAPGVEPASPTVFFA